MSADNYYVIWRLPKGCRYAMRWASSDYPPFPERHPAYGELGKDFTMDDPWKYEGEKVDSFQEALQRTQKEHTEYGLTVIDLRKPESVKLLWENYISEKKNEIGEKFIRDLL